MPVGALSSTHIDGIWGIFITSHIHSIPHPKSKESDTASQLRKEEMDKKGGWGGMLCILRLPRSSWYRFFTSHHHTTSGKKPILSKHCWARRKTPSPPQGEKFSKVTGDNIWFLESIYSTSKSKTRIEQLIILEYICKRKTNTHYSSDHWIILNICMLPSLPKKD